MKPSKKGTSNLNALLI